MARRWLRLLLCFLSACGLIGAYRLLLMLHAEAKAWRMEAISISGAQVTVQIGEAVLVLDRGLLTLIGEKWSMLFSMSMQLLPPYVADILGGILDAMHAAISALMG